MMIDGSVINVDLKMTRFKYVWENISDPAIYDTLTGNCYFINDEDDIERIVGLLNEQQEKSSKLERQLRKAIVYLVSDTCSLSEKKLKEVINEIKNA